MQLKNILSFSVAAVLLASCGNVEFKKTKAGVPYKIFGEGKGEQIKQNYVVKFEVIQKVKDSVLFSTYKVGVPQYKQVPASISADSKGGSYADIIGTILEIFPSAHKGDSIYIVQKVDSLLRVNPQLAADPLLTKGSEIITTVRIVDFYKSTAEADAVINKERAAMFSKFESQRLADFKKDTAAQRQMTIDSKIIEDYLAANNIQAQKTDWGVYVQTITPGQGAKPKAGQYVTVQYRGTNLKGEEFDKGEIPTQLGTGGTIKGFEDGLFQLSQGAKARIFIPSSIGYGPQGAPPKIKPNEVLVFEVEMKNIGDTQPAPQMQAPPADPAAGQR